MKNFIEALLITVLFTAVTATPAQAQMAPVKCKHMTTGEIMTIAGQSCPAGWMRWY